MKKMFRIGEISRLYHVGVDTIRYYEQIGLICPKRSESGYRLYSQKDIWRLNVIRDLRELGFPTESIKDYLDFQNTDTALELLQQEQDTIDEKLRTLHTLRENVEKRMETIRIARQLPVNQPELREYPDRSCYRTAEGYSTDEEMDILIKTLLNRGGETPYIIGNNQIGSLLAPQPDGKLKYEAVFVIDDRGDNVLPGGKYLCVTYQGGYEQTGQWAKKLLEQSQAMGLQARGPILEILWIDIHTSRRIEEHITELQLPVEPRSGSVLSPCNETAECFSTEP